MTNKGIDKQAWTIFSQRFPGQLPKKGQIKEIRREIIKRNKKQPVNKKPIAKLSVKEIAAGRTSSSNVDPDYTPGDPFGYGKKKYKSTTEKVAARKAMAEDYRKYSVGPVVGAGGSSGAAVKLPKNYRILNAPPEKKIFIGGLGLIAKSKIPVSDSKKQSELDKRAIKLFQERFPGQQPEKGQIKEIKEEILKNDTAPT